MCDSVCVNKNFSINVRTEIFWESIKTKKILLKKKKKKMRKGWKAEKKNDDGMSTESTNIVG